MCMTVFTIEKDTAADLKKAQVAYLKSVLAGLKRMPLRDDFSDELSFAQAKKMYFEDAEVRYQRKFLENWIRSLENCKIEIKAMPEYI